ncbi:MAG: four helix bundle protein [Proteobacteria bacterium]|nr:four helix bundle protein [Pseudomonadota bacterium]
MERTLKLRPQHYQLEVWQEAMQLVRQVYGVSDQLPDKERFGLQAQLRRAAVSVPSNIAEGSARGSAREFVRFLQIARGSLMETDTQLWLCHELGYFHYQDELKEHLGRLFAKLNALIRSKSDKAGEP